MSETYVPKTETVRTCDECGVPLVRRPRVWDYQWSQQIYCGSVCQVKAIGRRARQRRKLAAGETRERNLR